MNDFEKILEITRMAKLSAQEIKEMCSVNGTESIIGRLAANILLTNNHFKYIHAAFNNTKHELLAVEWYRTVKELRMN